MKFVINGLEVSWKNKFQCSCMNDLGPRSRNVFDLEYSCSLIYSFNSLHLPLFKSQTAKVSENYKVMTFSHIKVYAHKLTLA